MSDLQELRVLTVRQPWAWAIIHGGKNIENRTRNIAGDYRGPVAIHAAKGAGTFQEFSANCRRVAELKRPVPFGIVYGHIIGVVDLIDVHGPCDGMRAESGQNVSGTRHWGTWTSCGDWAEPGAHHLVFENPRALDEPIPWKGALGLRRTDMFVTGDWIGAHIDPPVGHSCTPFGCPPSCYSEPVAKLQAVSA